MSSLLDWLRRWTLGRPERLATALKLLDMKEAAAKADIRALRRRADEEIDRLSGRSLM